MTAADAGRVSDADREVARHCVTSPGTWVGPGGSWQDNLTECFAHALATERARAVADLRAAVEELAEELEGWRANAERYADAHAGSIAHDRALGRARAYERATDRLRAVLDATSEQQP